MNGDFGAELDAALKESVAKVWAAADEARERIERTAAGLAAATQSPAAVEQDQALQPYFEDEELGAVAAVDFGLEPLPEAPVDNEGIPFPDEGPQHA